MNLRRAYRVGAVALGLALAATHGEAAFDRAAGSARNFRQCFHDLKTADETLNPVERFAYSLLLTQATQSDPEAATLRPSS